MEIYNVTRTGETTFVTAATLKEALLPDKVLIIIVDDLKTIFLWKGTECGVRKKFIGARVSQAVRGERGLLYKVDPIDQNDEPQAFVDLFDAKPAESPTAGASMDMAEGGIVEESLAGPAAVTLSNEMKEKLMGEALPGGFEREGIVIGRDYYGVIKSTSVVLGKTVESEDIQKTEELPDGQLFNSNYRIRLMVENGNIAAVEILKKKEIEVPEEIKAEVKVEEKVVSEEIRAEDILDEIPAQKEEFENNPDE
ncbi:MAG: hypothetical protein HWN66_20805 [Candidatus Helarchaeota archaeon]|nr:hypothetical protein [Candidatus Helarchaeota archaeon]